MNVIPGVWQLLSDDRIYSYGAITEGSFNNNEPLLLTWFNFNPSMDK